MSLVSMKCDNDDGTINWESRARIVTALSRSAGMTLEKCLSNIIDNVELEELIKKRWKELDINSDGVER